MPPTELTRKLASLRLTLRVTVAMAGAAAPALALFVWFLASLAIDRVLEPAVAWRAALLIAGAAAAVWLIVTRLILPATKSWTDDDLAVLVERHWPDLDGRFISAVQLARLPDPELLNMSPAMVAQLSADAAGQTERLEFGQLVDRARGFRGPAVLVSVVGAVALFAWGLPAEFDVWFHRAVLLQDIRRPRQTQLVLIDPDSNSVKRRKGDSLLVVVEVADGSTVPEIVEAFAAGGAEPDADGKSAPGPLAWLTGKSRPVAVFEQHGDRVFKGLVKNLRSDTVLRIRGGDDELDPLTVTVVDPVGCKGIDLKFHKPDYIDGAPEIRRWGERLEVPAGTRVELVGTADKPLSKVEMRIPREHAVGLSAPDLAGRPAGDDPRTLVFALPADAVSGDTFRTGFMLSKSVVIEFVLTDTDGLTNFVETKPIRLEIDVQPDRAPTASLRLRGISDMVTTGARLPMQIVLRDDHGIREARVAALVAPTPDALLKDPKAKATEVGEMLLHSTRFGPAARKVELDDLTWEIGELGLRPGQRVELDVQARDYRPGGVFGTLDERSRKPLEVVTPETLLVRLVERQIGQRSDLEQKIISQQRLLTDLETAIEKDTAVILSDESYQLVRRASLGQGRLADDIARMRQIFQDIGEEMENNRVGSVSERARIADIVDRLASLHEERMSLLRPGLETVLTLLTDAEGFAANWDADGDGALAEIEFRRMQSLLQELDPKGDFPPADLTGSHRDLGGLFRDLDTDKNGLLNKAELDNGRAVLRLRLTMLATASAVQRDSLERMRQVMRYLPRSEKFGAVVQELRRLIDRQREAERAVRKAGEQAAQDVFDK